MNGYRSLRNMFASVLLWLHRCRCCSIVTARCVSVNTSPILVIKCRCLSQAEAAGVRHRFLRALFARLPSEPGYSNFWRQAKVSYASSQNGPISDLHTQRTEQKYSIPGYRLFRDFPVCNGSRCGWRASTTQCYEIKRGGQLRRP